MHRSLTLALPTRLPVAAVSGRSFHQSPNSPNNASRETRLSGRRRFYKHVAIIPVAPPWETVPNVPGVESPVSAGVDGSQSASGVTLDLPSPLKVKEILQFRNPQTNEVIDCHQWYGVTLDGRSIKTPLGKQFAVPSELLAWAVAAEWDAQQRVLKPAQMPLMTLTCTAMDQIAADPETYRDHVLRYLPTDNTCYWADPAEDRVLHRKQQEAWEPLHSFCESVLKSRPSLAMGSTEGVIMSRARSRKQSGLPHPSELLQEARDWLEGLDAWNLCAMHSVTAESKSFLVGMAVLLPQDPVYDLRHAIQASRVEEEFQIANWGLVEGGHDYDRLNCSIQIQAAHLLTSSIALGTKNR